MPYKDPEKQREARRRYRERNREQIREKGREQRRQYYAQNRERLVARQRDYYRTTGRARYLATRDPARESAANLRSKHGLTTADLASMLDAQGGCCYLCGEPLAIGKAVIDHDHSCCTPTPTRQSGSCRWCRRGVACNNCNAIIGMARDDPARLRRIASALEATLPVVTARLASKPQQSALFPVTADAAT